MEGPTVAELLRDFIVATSDGDATMQQAYYDLLVRKCQNSSELLGTYDDGEEAYGVMDSWSVSDGKTGLVINFAVELMDVVEDES